MLVLVNVDEADPAGRGSPLTYWCGAFGTHDGDKN
jgi:hypothetical protein